MTNAVLDTIAARRSHRAYQDTPVTQAQLDALLAACLQSPSAVNKQPWHISVVRDKQLLSDINDATREDAVACGLDRLCEVIDSGSDAPGTPLALCSPDFRARFAAADCIIAKGMGNFESLSDAPAPLFFLFVVKCTTVLAHLRARFPEAGLRIGSPVLLRGEAAA